MLFMRLIVTNAMPLTLKKHLVPLRKESVNVRKILEIIDNLQL